MVVLRTRNKITDFLMILAWASPFKSMPIVLFIFSSKPAASVKYCISASNSFMFALFFKNTVQSSAYWLSFIYFFLCIKTASFPWMFLFSLILIARTSTTKINKRADTGHPCLIPLSMVILDNRYPLFLAPAVTVGERRELWILPPFFFGLFFCL